MYMYIYDHFVLLDPRRIRDPVRPVSYEYSPEVPESPETTFPLPNDKFTHKKVLNSYIYI